MRGSCTAFAARSAALQVAVSGAVTVDSVRGCGCGLVHLRSCSLCFCVNMILVQCRLSASTGTLRPQVASCRYSDLCPPIMISTLQTDATANT